MNKIEQIINDYKREDIFYSLRSGDIVVVMIITSDSYEGTIWLNKEESKEFLSLINNKHTQL